MDDTYLDEVLTNLVENAVRYGGSLDPDPAPAQLPDGDSPAVEVIVEDDGPGVPDADIGAPLRQVLSSAAVRASARARGWASG